MTIKETQVSDEEAQTGEPEIEVPSIAKDDLKKAVPMASAVLTDMEGIEFPSAFYCPITKKVMVDPVVHPSGDSYEKEAIMNRQGEDSLSTFYPNRALKAAINHELERSEEEGSMRGTIRTLDNNLRSGWDKLVEAAALPFGESRPLPDGK